MDRYEISAPIAKAGSAIAAAYGARKVEGHAESVAASAVEAAQKEAASMLPYVPEATVQIWTAVQIVPWATVASLLAATYSLVLLSEWFWKRLWRPLLERWGVITPLKRRSISVEEYEADEEKG